MIKSDQKSSKNTSSQSSQPTTSAPSTPVSNRAKAMFNLKNLTQMSQEKKKEIAKKAAPTAAEQAKSVILLNLTWNN